MKKLIEVEHKGVEGTAWMPETALKTMTGWKPVGKTAVKKAAATKTADSASEAPKEES